MEGKGLFLDSDKGAIPCRLYLAGDQLNIYLENEGKEMLIWNTGKLHRCEWKTNALLCEYGTGKIDALECHGEIAIAIFHRHTKSSATFIKPRSERNRYWIPLLILVLLITLAVFLWMYLVPWLGEKAATLVPVEAEISMGNSLSAMYGSGVKEDDSANVLIQKLMNQIQVDDTYPIKVRVIRSDEINAFALPGGHIFVYSGIISRMRSYEELVALLGHEFTHIQKRHSLKSICRSAAGSLLVSSLLGDAAGVSSTVLMQADKFKELDYSRDLETEADNEGLQIMRENRINTAGMLKLLELLKKEGAETPGLMKYLSTHPDTQARIDNVRSQIAKTDPADNNIEMQRVFSLLQRSLKDS